MLKMEAFAGAIRPDQRQGPGRRFDVPAERRPEQSRLEVRYSPTLAGALVDALPYLADYPYGCTEQTLNRFLPTVITQKILINLGLDLKAIRDKHTNLNAQELGDARERAKRWKGYEHNPVFDQAEVAKMAAAGIQRLADMQLSDGGWGWFSGFGEHSSPHTTALVVHGLQIARQNDLALPEGMLERGVAWLTSYQAKQVQLLENGVSEVKPYKKFADDLDALVFMVLDRRRRPQRRDARLPRPRPHPSLGLRQGHVRPGAREARREGQAGDGARRTSASTSFEDDENQTAYLKLPNEGYWWCWYGSEIETDAFYLKLLARTDPKGELAPRLVKYVLNNRKHGTYWNSTRDTAFCIEALADYLKASGEDRPDMTVAIAVDGQTQQGSQDHPGRPLHASTTRSSSRATRVETGEHTVSFVKQGKGPLYFNAYLTNFTLEDPITRAGLEIKVDRKVYRLIQDDKTVDVAGGRGQAVGQKSRTAIAASCSPRGRRSRAASWSRSSSRSTARTTTSTWSSRTTRPPASSRSRCAAATTATTWAPTSSSATSAWRFFARTLARGKHSVSLPPPRRDPRQVPRPARPGPGHVRTRAEGELGRDPARGGGLSRFHPRLGWPCLARRLRHRRASPRPGSSTYKCAQ